MSRSYKKHPYAGDNKDKFMKRYSNHKIRRQLKNPNYILKGGDFKKIVEPWDICDYWYYQSWNSYKKDCQSYYDHAKNYSYYQKHLMYLNEDELYQEWSKYYRRK